MYELSLSAAPYAAFTAAVHDHLTRIAVIGGNAFLYLRAGDEVVCVDRAGTTAVPPVTVIGRRRPIAESTFGIAMILAMPLAEGRELLQVYRRRAEKPRKNLTAYRRVLKRSRACGYGLNCDDVIPGVSSIAIALRDSSERPFAAIGVTAPAESLRDKRLQTAVRLVQTEARDIEKELAPLIARLSH